MTNSNTDISKADLVRVLVVKGMANSNTDISKADLVRVIHLKLPSEIENKQQQHQQNLRNFPPKQDSHK